MDYTIVLNARNASSGTNNNSLVYDYDFTHFEEGHYELTWNYIGTHENITNQYGYMVETNFILKSYEVENAVSNCIGVLESFGEEFNGSRANYLIARMDTNVPMKLDKPALTQIRIDIKNFWGGGAADYNGTEIGDYMMMLHFKKC